MGLERRWLQAVTAAVAICLLSKYANANMDPLHTFTMHLHNYFSFLQNFNRSSNVVTDISQYSVILLIVLIHKTRSYYQSIKNTI